MMMMYDGLIVGFNQAIYGNAIKVLGGNIQIHSDGYRAKANQTPLIPLANDQAVVQAAEANPQILVATRRINTGGLITSPEGAFAVGIIGIEPEKEAEANITAQNVKAGRFLAPDDGDVIFIGKGLADAMGAQVGDRVTLTGRSTHDQMRTRTMTVIGVYDLNIPDIEKRTVYMSLGEAQDLYGLTGQSTEVGVILKQLGQEAAVIAALKPELPGYEIESWETNYPELTTAISSKGAAMNVMSVVIMLIAGIGIRPNVELAEAAKLKVENGIVVDEFLRTSHPDIYAAGDVAAFYSPVLGTRLRVEHEDNANTMGKMAGQAMAGQPVPYHHLPFFYSDLFDLGYEAVGELNPRLETVVDWQEPYHKGVIYYVREGRVAGVLLWNVWGQVEVARKLIAEPGPFRAADLKGKLPF
jgi:hypothetical protein